VRLNSQRRHALNFFVRCKSIMLHNVNILMSCVVPQNWHKICCDLSKSALIVYIFHKSMSRVPFLLEAAWYRLSTFENKSKFSNEIFCRKKNLPFFCTGTLKKTRKYLFICYHERCIFESWRSYFFSRFNNVHPFCSAI